MRNWMTRPRWQWSHPVAPHSSRQWSRRPTSIHVSRSRRTNGRTATTSIWLADGKRSPPPSAIGCCTNWATNRICWVRPEVNWSNRWVWVERVPQRQQNVALCPISDGRRWDYCGEQLPLSLLVQAIIRESSAKTINRFPGEFECLHFQLNGKFCLLILNIP